MKRYRVSWIEESTWEHPTIINAEDEDEAQDLAFGRESTSLPKQVNSEVIEVFVEEVEE